MYNWEEDLAEHLCYRVFEAVQSRDGRSWPGGYAMIEMTVDSIRMSLMTQHRMVILKDVSRERYLAIVIGPAEADAIAIKLQNIEVPRPLTHDLLSNVIRTLGARVTHILINDLVDETYYGRIIMDVDGRHVEVDSRPSDAIALAVRLGVPIYVAEHVLDRAGIVPEHEDEEKLAPFREVINKLNLDDLGSGPKPE